MQEIINIADPKILAIPINECGEALIDIKDINSLLYGEPPECELTANCYTKMRKTIFQKLIIAQKALPKGFRFRLYEAYRSLEVQKILFGQEFERVTKLNKSLSYEARFHKTTQLVSPVINIDGTKNIPPHNTGSAVDIEIIHEDGTLLDMGMEAKDWVWVDSELCLTNSNQISETAKNNRKLLLKVMEGVGFINYPNEWWHFSYGDRYWAYCQTNKIAIFGTAENYII